MSQRKPALIVQDFGAQATKEMLNSKIAAGDTVYTLSLVDCPLTDETFSQATKFAFEAKAQTAIENMHNLVRTTQQLAEARQTIELQQQTSFAARPLEVQTKTGKT
jgi:hypothetical protein